MMPILVKIIIIEIFLNADDDMYDWYDDDVQVNLMLMITPDIKDLMTRIFIASCYGALNATMVKMVMAMPLMILFILCDDAD